MEESPDYFQRQLITGDSILMESGWEAKPVSLQSGQSCDQFSGSRERAGSAAPAFLVVAEEDVE